MKRIVEIGLVVFTLLVAVGCHDDASVALNTTTENLTTEEGRVAENGTIIQGKYIIQFHNDAIPAGQFRSAATYSQKQQVVKDFAISVLGLSRTDGNKIERSFASAIKGFSGELTDSQVDKLKADRRVKSVEPDRLIILGKPSGGGTGTTVQEIPWGITRVGGAGSGVGKTAWIIDTGIDLDHADLNVDATRGFSAFTTGRDAGFDDGNGHGTHVAGTVAALNNSIGVVGVAAGAKVVPVKVLDSRGSGAYSGVIDGVNHVAAYAASGDAANMSLGGPISVALDDAVKAAAAKGIKFALAAGNETDDANNHSPARVNGANIYTISAMDSADKFASFSNYGNPPVDYCAPGVSIKSTWKGGGYNTISGTSMASPHVCGLLLLGNIATSGTVRSDPDGNADPIAHR